MDGLWSNISTTMVPPTTQSGNLALGFGAAAVAVVFFGSNFIPVKKFQTGDGMFFQWVMCSAIWLTGLVINCIQNFPPFYPLAMLGGFLWATGNIAVVPIIQTVGLSQGLLIWASFNLIVGWITGRFGLFGMKPEVPKNLTLNYIGMALCFCSAFIYILIKSETTPVPENSTEGRTSGLDTEPLVTEDDEEYDIPHRVSVNRNHEVKKNGYILERMSPRTKRVVGTVLAICAGTLFGVNFIPVIYIQDNYHHSSNSSSNSTGDTGLDYVFAHFSGIYLTSTFYFLLYCAVMKNQPRVFPKVVIPGFISGVMWAIADAGWFIANSELSEPVSFPIITSGPGIVGAIWGVFLFKEIQGKRNYLLLLVAFTITITGGVLTGLSKT